MSRGEDEALYGGAAGGGKSDFILAEALRQVHIPHYRGIIFRKTYPQLTALIDRSRDIYQPAYRKARYNETGHVWKFPSGAKIYFGSSTRRTERITRANSTILSALTSSRTLPGMNIPIWFPGTVLPVREHACICAVRLTPEAWGMDGSSNIL